MKKLCTIALLLVAGTTAFAVPPASAAPRVPVPPTMPRYRFENFTTANGLPDNHVFAVLVDEIGRAHV